MARALLCTAAVLLALALHPALAAADQALPAGSISATRATGVANHDPKVVAERDHHPDLNFSEGDEVALVLVDPRTARVKESWTGYQVAWKMARGYSGAFGHKLNAPYVFLPICAIFLLGLLDWRRPWRIANLDLCVLLGFGVSHFFFNRAEIGVSVPIVYPLLLYLFGRSLWIGFRGRGEGVRPVWPAAWLLIAALFLVGLRVGLNVADSGAIDVGYASVVGADRIAHGEQLYDNFPDDVSQGDTYGPVNYYAYVPSERIWPWSGSWDDLPAAHAAAVLFDLATFALLFLLGRRVRPGPSGFKLGATLAFGWAAYPYTAYVLESNSNDSLVAMLQVATLCVLARPAARGAMAALATFTKFAPLLLAPMLLTYRASRRSIAGFALAFAAVTVLVMAWPAIDPGLHTFYERTITYQADRDSPFSIWGQVESLAPLRTAILVLVGGLSIGLAFRPRHKSLTQVAALGAALIIGLQLTAEHWFYLYIVWFYPLLLVAMVTVGGSKLGETPPKRSAPEPSPGR
jgi:hypothetical protein